MKYRLEYPKFTMFLSELGFVGLVDFRIVLNQDFIKIFQDLAGFYVMKKSWVIL